MARTHLDETPEYMESVRAAILASESFEDNPDTLDEHALELTACYLWWNGYKTKTSDDRHALYPQPRPHERERDRAYFAYHVLAWTEANT